LRNGLVAEANGKLDDRKSMNCLTCLLSVICRFAVICFVLAIVSCGRPGKGSNGAPSGSASELRSQDSDGSPKKELFEYQVERTGFTDFEAVDLPLSEVFSMIEGKFNSCWESLEIKKLKIVTINPTDMRLTIVLKRVKLMTLLDLIEQQTRYQYRVDNDRREIKFFHTDDIIGDDGATDSQENEAEEKPGTSFLPPP
jgi:hypothetical protein